MYMGSLTLAISYKDVLMGYVTSTNMTMVRGPQTMSMTGVLIPQNTTEGLAVTSEMMSRYIGNELTNTTATGVEVKPDGVNALGWLSDAVKSLKLTVPLQSPVPLQLIKALNLGALGLVFTPPTAYEPVTTSTGVLANYSLPDGFNFNISFQQVSNTFALTRGGVTIANLNSSYNPSTSNMAAGTLTFNLLATPLLVPDASHEPFQEFTRDLTVGADLPFNVVGEASVYANTSIGVVNLVNIPFNASTQLSGLQSLANPAPTITALQVVSGTTTGLTMAISVIIINPSSISLSAGDVILALVYKGVNLGTVTMPNLSIVPGANTIATSSTIDPAKSPEGIELLTLYTSGAGASVSIAGTPNSTAVESLSLAFGALNIETQMPGLQSKLLAGASLEVLNTTLVNGLAQTVVTINNPFVPAMTILSIDSKITYNGVAVGSVVSTFATPPVIPGVGQGTITASLAMNTNPTDLITLIRTQAIKNGMSTAAFDGLISLQSGGTPPASLFVGFNVADFTLKAMAGLLVDITMTTTVKVGDYQVTIPYTQTGVATATDASLLKLIPLVGTPIAQVLVDGSVLQFDSIRIISPTDTNFQIDIEGAISNTGPLDAQIVFPNPVTVSYDGKTIGSMMMPTVNAVANQGATLNMTGVMFTISDIDAYTAFTVFALNNAKFEWTIATTGVVVNAMGVPIPGVSMTKTVTFDGFNKLAGLVLNPGYMIEDVDAAGLHMVISATINNPSTIGMTIPLSQFNTQFQGTVLGPAVAVGLTLIPHASSDFSLNATIATGLGNMVPYLEGIFTNAVTGKPTPLEAQGVGAPGVSWLNTAIKSLTLSTSLPPLVDPPIVSVAIDAMYMDFSCDTCTWEPTAISIITAKTNLPFRNGAPIRYLSQNVNILDGSGQVVGLLSTDYANATSTGDTVTSTSPDNSTLVVADGSHTIYENFIRDLTNATHYTLGLKGTANSKLDLGALGLIEIKGIALDVQTNLDGLQGLQNITFIAMPSIYLVPGEKFESEAFSQVNIYNPSKLTLNIGTMYLDAGVNYTSAGLVGNSTLHYLVLAPGDNILIAELDLYSLEYAAAQAMASAIAYSAVTVYLYGFPGSSPNVAEAAGLSNLQTKILVNALAAPNLPAYLPTWTATMLPTTIDDGIFDMTVTFMNPYPGVDLSVISWDEDQALFPEINAQGFAAAGTNFSAVPFATWFADPTEKPVVLNTDGGPMNVSLKMMLLNPDGASPSAMGMLDDLVATAAKGPLITTFEFFPVIVLGNNPAPLSMDWSCYNYYDPTGAGCTTTLITGPDFSVYSAYIRKLLGTSTTPSASASSLPTASGSASSPSPSSTAGTPSLSLPTTSPTALPVTTSTIISSQTPSAPAPTTSAT